MFSSRQGASESIASWSTKIDTMQSELRVATYRICEDEEVICAVGLINLLNAKLNPSCKSQLAEFFWVGI